MNQPSTNKKSLSVLIGAAFLMATSSIGPGFMTQTAAFTAKYQADFAFVIAASVILSYIAQLNVWSIITVSKLRGQDIANRVLPGLGYFVAFLVALGGLAFNIGNIGGAALGMNVMFGINIDAAAIVSAVIGIIVFMSRSAAAGLDLVFGFNITDEDKHFSLIVKDSTCELKEGENPDAQVTLVMDGETLEGIVSGETDGMQAFMSGKLRAEGDMMLAMKLGELFPV